VNDRETLVKLKLTPAQSKRLLYALKSGWIELEGDHSIRLTDEGKRLILKQAH
jgi:Mn-dependent DtxR family transcriptional regulator